MKITKSQLKRIIKEELNKTLKEADFIGPFAPPRVGLDTTGKLKPGTVIPGGMDPPTAGGDVEQLIEQGRTFFDQVIQLSMASEDDPDAQEKLNQVEEALSREVHEKSHGWVKFTIVG